MGGKKKKNASIASGKDAKVPNRVPMKKNKKASKFFAQLQKKAEALPPVEEKPVVVEPVVVEAPVSVEDEEFTSLVQSAQSIMQAPSYSGPGPTFMSRLEHVCRPRYVISSGDMKKSLKKLELYDPTMIQSVENASARPSNALIPSLLLLNAVYAHLTRLGYSAEDVESGMRHIDLRGEGVSKSSSSISQSIALEPSPSLVAQLVLDIMTWILFRGERHRAPIVSEVAQDATPINEEEKDEEEGKEDDSATSGDDDEPLLDGKEQVDTEDNDMGLTGMFDEEAAAAALEEDDGRIKVYPREEYTYDRRWHANSPKDLLNELVARKGGKYKIKTPSPVYSHVTNESMTAEERAKYNVNGYRAQVMLPMVDAEAKVFCMPVTACCMTQKEAEQYAATQALYGLESKTSLYLRLPPPFRTLWHQLAQQNMANDAQETKRNHTRRIDFIRTLMQEYTECFEGYCKTSLDIPSAIEHIVKADTIAAPSDKPKFVSKAQVDLTSGWSKRMASKAYQQMLTDRKQLPVYAFKDEILTAVTQNSVSLVVGETGSGKTTQIPHFLLQHALECNDATANIYVTQPRRITAISVAERVSAELGEERKCGRSGSYCGYQVKLENRTSNTTKLRYVTTGILMRKLSGDPSLSDITHVVIDEVHERTIEADFLLIVLKRLLATQRAGTLKVVLMSATMDSVTLQSYFASLPCTTCPLLSIPGRTFPVRHYFLRDAITLSEYNWRDDNSSATFLDARNNALFDQAEAALQGKGGIVASNFNDASDDAYLYGGMLSDTKVNHDLIEAVLMAIISGAFEFMPSENEDDEQPVDDNGAVLVFMPGFGAIQTLYDRLSAHPEFGDSRRYLVSALHSSLSSVEQQKVFRPPGKGKRKIIISTNIAETGVTIPDIVYVIDTGKMKEMRYNARTNINALREVYVSQANAKQRAGRAGRLQSGICIRLYAQEKYDAMPHHWQPEILRMPLEALCLHVLANFPTEDVVNFFSDSVTPPSSAKIEETLGLLQTVGAVSVNQQVLPTQPQVVARRPSDDGESKWFEDSDDDTGKDVPVLRYLLTPLGELLAQLPLDVRVGRMVVFGALLQCLDPILIIAAAAATGQSIFQSSFDQQQTNTSTSTKAFTSDSDQIRVLKVFRLWHDACNVSDSKRGTVRLTKESRKIVRQHNLREASLLEMSKVVAQLRDLIMSMNIGAQSQLNTYSGHPDMVRCAIVTGLYPNVAHVQPARVHSRTGNNVSANNHFNAALIKQGLSTFAADGKCILTELKSQKQRFMHPSSCNKQYRLPIRKTGLVNRGQLLVYQSKFETHRVSLVDVTIVHVPLPVLILCCDNEQIRFNLSENIARLDTGVEINLNRETILFIRLLQRQWKQLLTTYVHYAGNRKTSLQNHYATFLAVLASLLRAK